MKLKVTCECGKYQYINPAQELAKQGARGRKRDKRGKFVKVVT